MSRRLEVPRQHLQGLVAIVLLALAGAACADEAEVVPAKDAPATEETAEQEVNWLFVMTTTSGRYDGDMLTLVDVPPTLLFSDRPVRAFGHMQTPALVEELAGEEGPESFREDPPNAVLSTFRPGQQPTAATVILTEEPIVDGASLHMKVTVQDGEIPAEFGAASLFIDHWHGGHHHRRGHHRHRHRRGGVVVVEDSHPGAALVTGIVVGAAVAHAADSKQQTSSSAQAGNTKTTAENTTQTTQTQNKTTTASQNVYVQTSGAPAATPEQRLEEAKDMHEKGLISDEEYEKKKSDILNDI